MTNQFSRRTKKERPTTVKEALTTNISDHQSKLTVRLDPDLHQKFRMLAMAEQRSLTEVITELITAYIQKRTK